MEAKTILRLIKDDIADLEGIAGEFIFETLPSSDEVDLAIVRAKAILKELELLHKYTISVESSLKTVNRIEIPSTETLVPDQAEHEPFELFDREPLDYTEVPKMILDQDQYDPIESDQEPVSDIVEPIAIIELPDQSPSTTVEEDVPVAISSDNFEQDVAVEQVANKEDVVIVDNENLVTSEVINDEELIAVNISDHKEEILVAEVAEAQKTLGETLGEPHQMVNDILSQEKIDSEYQIIPINSIWDGIGINDRFLFIRELFANSSAKFENTVGTLDKLTSIQEAVNYLKLNFKWNKTEASQKFLVLVKRRFTK